jgi:hypothetical protein
MAKKRALSWKDVLNNFLLRLVGTGQFPLLLFIGLLALMVYRTPSDRIVDVWVILQQMLDRKSGLGYTLAAVCGAGWIGHTKWQRRQTEKEMLRLSKERTDAQQLHFSKKLESSKK